MCAAGTSSELAMRQPWRAASPGGRWARGGRNLRFADADVVLETIVEDLDRKCQLLSTVQRWVSSDTLLATNTSSLPLASIADSLHRPGRFGGLHFLHPAHATGVVEVIAAPRTEPTTLEALSALVRSMAKRPIVLHKAEPGFVWNRLQFALLRECLHLLDDGVTDVEGIDTAISEGLAPRWLAAGPLATIDLGGAETFARIAEQLNPRLASAPTVSPSLLEQAAGGAGFHPWDDERRQAVEDLRAEALQVGRVFAKRRQAIVEGDPQA